MKCPYCDNGVSRCSHPGFRWPCTICDGTGAIEQTNFEIITKNEETLAKWLSEKTHFCRFVSCDECMAYVSDDECKDVTNAELWSAWLKQPYKETK